MDRDWVQGQIRGGVRSPEWLRKDLIGEIGATSSQLFHRIGGCRFSLYLAPKMAADLHEMWSIVSEHRMQASGWEMDFLHSGPRAY